MKYVFVLLFVLTGITYAAPASAAPDTTHCVSKSEFNSMHDGSLSRTELEDRFGVTGLGLDYYDPWFGDFIIYPKCGAEKALTKGLFWYGVKYKNHETAVRYLIWDH